MRGNGEVKSIIFSVCILISIAHLPVSNVASCLVPQQPRNFDHFGNISCEDELARLDNFSNQLQSNLEAQGYIIVYGGRRGRRNEAKARAARMKFYLLQIRGLDAKRIFTLDGGYREELSGELWLVQHGESAPLPTPTVKLKDVKLKGRVKVRGYSCGEGLG